MQESQNQPRDPGNAGAASSYDPPQLISHGRVEDLTEFLGGEIVPGITLSAI